MLHILISTAYQRSQLSPDTEGFATAFVENSYNLEDVLYSRLTQQPELTWERSVPSYWPSRENRDNVLQHCKCLKSKAAKEEILNAQQLFAMFSQ